jgi:hypothetical protein
LKGLLTNNPVVCPRVWADMVRANVD